MISIIMYLMHDRERCDALLERACADVDAMDWDGAGRSLAQATQALARHLQLEESYLFGPYDACMEDGCSRTAVLRREHGRVSAALAVMAQAAAARERGPFLRQAETLRLLLAYHHLQEQDTFYPLAGRLLKARTVLAKQVHPDHAGAAA
jgi:hypothetical protein